MVIETKVLIQQYRKLLKTTKQDSGNKGLKLVKEARLWDHITEEHYGLYHFANSARLRQIIYRDVANLMATAQQSADKPSSTSVKKANQLLTKVMRVQNDHMYNVYEFRVSGALKPLNRQDLIAGIKGAIKGLSQVSEISIGQPALS